MSTVPSASGSPKPSLSDAGRIVKQHAYTAALMGLDVVPAFSRRRGAAGAPRPPAEVSSSAATAATAPEGGIADEVSYPDSTNKQALEAVRARYLADAPHKAFGYHFNKLVFGEGDPQARLMFIGEAPGADEDRTGRPFVGRAGVLLNDMIKAMGIRRQDVYIANVLKVRPPNNATPTHEERAASAPYLFEQIAAIKPGAIVTLGLPATQVVLATDQPLGKLRGIWGEFRHPDQLRYGGLVVPVMPTYHPAFLLRAYTPENRKLVWSDLRKAMERLKIPLPAAPAKTE